MARAWMSRITGPTCTPPTMRRVGSDGPRLWVARRYDRDPDDRCQVPKVIGELRASDPTVSATRALRALRDAGYACEQKRFGQLFRDTEASE